MKDCDCSHDAGMHAPRTHFGEAICLAPNCDCNGSREDVAEMVKRHVERKRKRETEES